MLKNGVIFFFIDFYKVSEDVLAFCTGSAAGASLYWLDINDPDTLYEAEGSPGEPPNGILRDANGYPNVWILHKNDTEPNEPENNYLSVYRLRACLVSFKYNTNKSQRNHLKRILHKSLTIFPKPATFIKPAKRTLNDPTFRKNRKGMQFITFHNLNFCT